MYIEENNMGFNKIYINFEKIISAWKNDGAEGVAYLYQHYDCVIMTDKTSMYIGHIMGKDEENSYKHKLIEVYMEQLLDGLHTI